MRVIDTELVDKIVNEFAYKANKMNDFDLYVQIENRIMEASLHLWSMDPEWSTEMKGTIFDRIRLEQKQWELFD